jgi:hypothetical protein
MPWSKEQKLKHLLRLPWTLLVEVGDEPDEVLIRVAEIPSAVGSGVGDAAVEDFWASLSAALSARLDFGDRIPLPPDVNRLPWEGEKALAVEDTEAGSVFQLRSHEDGGVEKVPSTAREVAAV